MYPRGRNATGAPPAKNRTITDYRRATVVEALLGYIYLNHKHEGLTELLSVGLRSMDEGDAEEAGKLYFSKRQ